MSSDPPPTPLPFDRRAVFFLVAAGLAGVLVPVTTETLRYVPVIVAVAYLVLAVASFLDWRTHNR